MTDDFFKKRKVLITASGGNKTPATASGEINEVSWGSTARLIRAAKSGGILLGLAALSLPIPVLHFILVPLFLVAAPVVGIIRYKQTKEFPAQEVRCPACGATCRITSTSVAWPIHSRCETCGSFIRIENDEG